MTWRERIAEAREQAGGRVMIEPTACATAHAGADANAHAHAVATATADANAGADAHAFDILQGALPCTSA